MSISLLCPTRARPEQLERMIASVGRTANIDNVNVIIGRTKNVDTHVGDGAIYYPDGMPTAHKWNLLAEVALKNPRNKLFMLCADDVIFSTPLWDRDLLDHYNALENKIHVYHLRDGRTGDGTPHPIVTREYIEAMGYFLPPMFLHWFVDTWTVEIAKANGCFTHMMDCMLDHIKPSDQGKPDSTHTGIRAMGWHDRDKWVHEHCQHFLEYEKSRLMAHFSKSARAVA